MSHNFLVGGVLLQAIHNCFIAFFSVGESIVRLKKQRSHVAFQPARLTVRATQFGRSDVPFP